MLDNNNNDAPYEFTKIQQYDGNSLRTIRHKTMPEFVTKYHSVRKEEKINMNKISTYYKIIERE